LISFFVAFLKPRSTTAFECHSIPSSILSQFIFKISLKKINYIIALTDPISSSLINMGISKSKILTAHDGFRMNRFLDLPSKNSVKRHINIHKSTFVVGYLGRFTTINLDKGIETLIDAMVGIPNSVLVLIGGPKEYFKLYEKYWRLKNLDRKNLIFINSLPPKLVTKYITCFDVGVIPLPYNKHFAYYSSPLKLFEYMASGIPVAASKFEAWKDVLNSNNSFSFQSSNAKQLNKILLYIKRNPTIAKKKAIIGKKLVLKEYTWDKRAMKILNFINIP
jgi:glycosyltransferase involved in cell wall biosynthesis